jgi:ATP synthase mitochondrial F1 complex assembly factor 1
MPRILSATPEQVSALWTAYHASRSEGTGRGYICASVPVAAYKKMEDLAMKYPAFVIPVSRGVEGSDSQADDATKPVEFYYLQWSFHTSNSEPKPNIESPVSSAETGFPEPSSPSVILFTPLQEYKLRQTFATPYLAVTHYTELVQTHGIVLMRGELTPSSANGGYFLTQEDAQRLCIAVQKFYLWGIDGHANDDDREKTRLLKQFHESPETFKWEELLKHVD